MASEHLLAARSEMDRRPVIHDWYCRMMLEEALTEVWLAKGDLTHARPEAERFLELTLATAERTWQARAREASARVAIAECDLHRAQSWTTEHSRRWRASRSRSLPGGCTTSSARPNEARGRHPLHLFQRLASRLAHQDPHEGQGEQGGQGVERVRAAET